MNREKIQMILKSKGFAVAAASVLSAAGGSVLTYKLTQAKLRAHYVEISEKEIAEAKLFYSKVHKTGEFADPVETLREYADVLEETNYATVSEVADVEEAVEEVADAVESIGEEPNEFQAPTPVVSRQNVFDKRHPARQNAPDEEAEGWNYEHELANRRNGVPYIIHHDEFMEGELDYEQASFRFYAGDGVLIDDREDMIPDSDAIVGDENLERFGHGSKDHKILYVRNERLEMDLEIVKHEGSYLEEVLGMDDDEVTSLQHSDRRRKRRKFRHDDE